MMAAVYKLPPLFFTLFLLFVSVSVCSSQCVDGTYEHDGRKCCLCGVGWHLVEHCMTDLQYGKCEACENGWYSSAPNHQTSCERCTSCSHPSENLEEDEPCTRGRDRRCRCKKDHYCVSQTDICKLCQPCKKCGEEGVKIPCAGNNNTVCNEKTEEGNNHGTVGITVAVLLPIIVLAVVGVFIWKKRTAKPKPDPTNRGMNRDGADVVNLIPKDVDLQRHLHDIAEIIGWKDMEHVAMRSGMPTGPIDACKMNYPNHVEEQTLQLLKMWVERQGREAPNNLIQMLKDIQKKGKAEKVIDILSNDNQNPPV